MANKGKKKMSKAMKSVLESPKKVEKSVKAAGTNSGCCRQGSKTWKRSG